MKAKKMKTKKMKTKTGSRYPDLARILDFSTRPYHLRCSIPACCTDTLLCTLRPLAPDTSGETLYERGGYSRQESDRQFASSNQTMSTSQEQGDWMSEPFVCPPVVVSYPLGLQFRRRGGYPIPSRPSTPPFSTCHHPRTKQSHRPSYGVTGFKFFLVAASRQPPNTASVRETPCCRSVKPAHAVSFAKSTTTTNDPAPSTTICNAWSFTLSR